MFSLQKLDGCGLIGVCLLECGDAFIKATMTGFVQLQSHLEEFSLIDKFLDFKLEDDLLTELAATWASKSKLDLVNLLVIDVLAHNFEGNGELEIALTLDILINSDANRLNREANEVTFFRHTQKATCFPWPVSTVHDFDVGEDNLAFGGLKNLLRLGNNLSALDVPVLAPIARTTFFTLVLHLPVLKLGLDVIKVNFNTHLSKEAADELSEGSSFATFPGIVSFSVIASTATTTSATTATIQRNELLSLWLLCNELIVVYLISITCFTFGLRKYSDHREWLLFRIADLKEWMLMLKTFLTHAAIVKVLADTALVAYSIDWRFTTTITSDVMHGTFFNNNSFLFLQVKVLASEQLIKDLLGLFVKFVLDEVLKCFTRDSFRTKGIIFALSFAVLFAIILHLSKHVNLFRLLLLLDLDRSLSNDRFFSDCILTLNDKLDGTAE